MHLNLKTKFATVVTVVVIALVSLAEWDERNQLAGEYLMLLQRQQQSTVDHVGDELDAKLALYLGALERASLGVDPDTMADANTRELFLHNLGGARTLFTSAGLITLKGDIVALDPPRGEASLPNVADRDYFAEVVATGRPAISAPLLARTSGQATVLMAVPLRDAGGTLIGVVSGALNLMRSNMLGSLRGAKVGETGYFVLRTRGTAPLYVVHPDPTKILQPAEPEAPVDGSLRATDRERPVTARKALHRADWDLEVVLPAAEAFAPLERAQQRMLGQTAIVAAALALLIWGLTFWMLRPLTRLHRAVRRLGVAGGHLEIPKMPRGELAELAAGFASAVESLQQRTAELQAVQDASPLGLFHCDLEGLITYANDTYLRMQNLSGERIADNWHALIPEARRGAVLAAWREGLRKPVGFESEVRAKGADEATPRLLRVRRAPVVMNGTLVGHVGTIEDITERRTHERAQRLLTAVFDATTDFIAQTDPAGRLVYLNRAGRERCGIALDADLSALTIEHFHPLPVIARLRHEILPIATARGTWTGETTGLAAGGVEVPLSHLVIAHRGHNGRVERFSAVMRDISAQKAASTDLARSEQTLRSVADALPAWVAVVDRDQVVRYANLALARFFARAPEWFVGRLLQDVLGEEMYADCERFIGITLTGQTVVFERPVQSRGPLQFRELTLVPLGAAEADGFVLIANDVTERKSRELELRERAARDPLTGLLNRAGFDAAIARLTAGHGTPSATSLAVLYIDLDHFKAVNDRHGHAAGDELLRAFAGRIRDCVRPSDPVCRLGGDEFAVLLPAVGSREQAERIASKIVAAAASSYELSAATVFVGASVGVVVSAGDRNPGELTTEADAMLYEAKRSGRGRHAMAH